MTIMHIISVLFVGASLLVLCHGQRCTVEEFTARLSDIECTQTDRQPILDHFIECGRDDFAGEVVENCRTHNNKTCNELLTPIFFRGPVEIERCYRDATFQETILPCTAECKEDLEAYINNTLGCCSRSIFEGVLFEGYPTVALIKSLIDACNISLPSPCTTSSPLSFTPSGAAESLCTANEVSRRLAEAACRPEALQMRLDLYDSCEYSNEAQRLGCERDDNGVVCATIAFDSSVLNILNQVALNCTQRATTCTEACRTAVISLRQNVGCCANNIYNSSFFALYSTSYELWSLCEVETIGFCDSGQVPAAGVTKLLFTIAFLVLALVF